MRAVKASPATPYEDEASQEMDARGGDRRSRTGMTIRPLRCYVGRIHNSSMSKMFPVVMAGQIPNALVDLAVSAPQSSDLENPVGGFLPLRSALHAERIAGSR